MVACLKDQSLCLHSCSPVVQPPPAGSVPLNAYIRQLQLHWECSSLEKFGGRVAGVHFIIVFHKTDANFWYQIFNFFMKNKQPIFIGLSD